MSRTSRLVHGEGCPRSRRRTCLSRAAPTVLAAAALLAACGADFSAVVTTVRDSAGITVVENARGAAEGVPRWTVGPEPSLRIGVVEGEAAYMFDRLWAGATLPDGRIVVISYRDHEVRLFGPDGRVLAVQGREGEGPGEYRAPQGLWILAGDTIAVFDPSLARVTLLTTEPGGAGGPGGDTLALARVATLEHGLMNPNFAGTVDDGRRVVIMAREFDISGPIQPQYADIWSVGIDGDDSRVDSVLRVVHGRHGIVPGAEDLGRMVGSPIFDARGSVAAAGDRIVYGSGDDHALHVHGPDGRLRRIIRWHGPDRTLDRAEVDRWVDSVIALTPEDRRPAERRWRSLLPVADRAPAHDRFLLDTAGRLWVSRWSPWDDQRRTEWWVFDESGRLVATAEMPAGTWVLEITDDEVLARVQDELGVEYVVTMGVR